MGNFRDFKNSFPEDSHSKGKAFERFLADWFFQNHPLYRHKFEKVWLWEDWPKPKGVAAQDLGTDLIARDTEGKIYAIQAKFYDVDSHIKFKDISTFLADSSKDYIDHRLLIGTAELAPNARKQLNSQEKPVSTFLLHDFEAWDFAWPKSLASLSKAKIKKPHEARPHQRAAIKDVCANLDGRGQLIMACGTGKTLTGQRIAEKLESETTLVLLPSLLLLSGTMNEWLQQTKVGFHYLPVCSDASVGGKAAPETNFTSGELGNASTTDPKDIRKFLRQKGNKVIFSTYQSSGRVADALEGTRIKFDLILADEAHRCAGKVAADYGYVLDEKKLPAKNRLFMTATPRIYKSNIKKAAKDADIQIASMDDESVFGPVVHHLTFGKAIEDKLLTDYQVVVVGVNDSAVGEMVDERALVKTEAGLERDAQTLGSQLGLMKAVKKYDLQRVITFHSRINQARDFASEFLEVMDATKKKDKPSGTITYSHVSGAMPTSERNNKLKALGLLEHEDRYLLGNARCLSEGVDVPALDGVAFVDPRRSEIDIIQAVGRAIRKSSSKTKGTIIIPVFIEEGDDPDLVLSSSAFDQVWKVVNALRAHDEKLGEELDVTRRELGRGESREFKSAKLVFDIHKSVDDSFIEAFETKLVEATTASWDFWFGLLLKYQENTGTCVVSGSHTERGYRLGQWVRSQRSLRVSGELSDVRRKKLDSIGFVWSIHEARWRDAIAALTTFHARNGNCEVPRDHVEEGVNLGVWIQTVRAKKDELSQQRLDQLARLDFVWDPLEENWTKYYTLLKRFQERSGHCLVVGSHTEDGHELGSWVRALRNRKEQLAEAKIAALDELGFVWDVWEEKWAQGYAALQSYYSRQGNSLVPAKHKEDGIPLGSWVGHQRKKKNNLSADQITALEQLDFIWDVKEEKWLRGYQELKLFHHENGHCVIRKGHMQNGFDLGNWIRSLRQRKSKLTEERIEALDALDFVWDELARAWDEGFEALKHYRSKNGHCDVPADHLEQGLALGAWVSNQRRIKQDLSPDRLEALNRLGFIWNKYTRAWEAGYDALKKFQDEYGHCLVDRAHVQDDFKLGNWVRSVRQRKNKLSREQLDALNSIGFVWDPTLHAWLNGYDALKSFHAKYNHCRVRRDYVQGDYKLGIWVAGQRKRRAKLTQEQRDSLDALGFVWSSTR